MDLSIKHQSISALAVPSSSNLHRFFLKPSRMTLRHWCVITECFFFSSTQHSVFSRVFGSRRKSRNKRWNSLTRFIMSSGTLSTECSEFSLRSIKLLRTPVKREREAIESGVLRRMIVPITFWNSSINHFFLCSLCLMSSWSSTGIYVPSRAFPFW